MPAEFWVFFWLSRYLMNLIPLIAATVIKDWAHEKGFLPGVFLAIHTFGRDLKRNIHIHLSTTTGGLSSCHIPDKNFRNIRYYGFLSHKLRGKLLPREARLLETRNAGDPVCSVKEECDICHIGSMIPVHYTELTNKEKRIFSMR